MRRAFGLVAKPLLEWAVRRMDGAVPESEIQDFLLAQLGRARRSPEIWESIASTPAENDLERAREAALAADLLPPETSDLSDAACEPTPASEPGGVRDWIRAVPDGRVVTIRRLVAGTGRRLDEAAVITDAELTSFRARSLEALLRNVEIRKSRSLVMEGANEETLWCERLDVAILFSREARRSGDLRMLNVALKLNDWAFPIHRRLPPSPRLARFLLSLAEQERAAHELLV